MKAQFIGLIIIIATLSTFLITLLSVSMNVSSSSVSVSAKESRILTAVEQTEAVKYGIKHMLNFSFQQAIYELAKRGSYDEDYEILTGIKLEEEEYPLWRNYSDKIFSNYLFMTKVPLAVPLPEDRLLGVMRKYVEKQVNLYKKKLDEQFRINLTSSNYYLYYTTIKDKKYYTLGLFGSISYSGDFFFINSTIKEDINVTYLATIYFDMIRTANETFLEKDSVREKIQNTVENLPSYCRVLEFYFCEQDYFGINPEEMLDKQCIDILNTSLNNNLESLSYVKDVYTINVKLNRSEISYSYRVTTDYQEDQNCGCKRFVVINKCEENTSISSGSDEKCLYEYCAEYYNRIKITIEYDYFIASKVLVNMTTRDLYPLYDENEKKISLRNIILKFSIITSNADSWKPINY